MPPQVRMPPQWQVPLRSKKRKACDSAPAPVASDDEFETVLMESTPQAVAVPPVEVAPPERTHDAGDHVGATEKRVMDALMDTRYSGELPGELCLDHLLAGVSYRLAIEGGGKGARGDGLKTSRVPIVSKGYEETYMREPYQGERACAAGALCECMFIDPANPFTGVEFVPYGVEPDPHPTFCVLCSRKLTQKWFYDILLTGKRPVGLIQRYGNMVNVPGEYARECALVCPTNGPLQYMPAPIMSHQRNKYEVYLHSGTRCIRQLRVGYEDFQIPSTEGAP